MAELVLDCPRCKAAHTTFDFLSEVIVAKKNPHLGTGYYFEAFCSCRACGRPSIFFLRGRSDGVDTILTSYHSLNKYPGGLNAVLKVEGYLSLADMAVKDPPEHIPDSIRRAFNEGAKCLAVGCYNAACAMFRLCLDLATKDLMPEEEVLGLTAKIRNSLGLRLNWLFDSQKLPDALRELSSCIKDHGNDGAHEGLLERTDAEDIMDFIFILLERLYAEPERIRIAAERRATRRSIG